MANVTRIKFFSAALLMFIIMCISVLVSPRSVVAGGTFASEKAEEFDRAERKASAEKMLKKIRERSVKDDSILTQDQSVQQANLSSEERAKVDQYFKNQAELRKKEEATVKLYAVIFYVIVFGAVFSIVIPAEIRKRRYQNRYGIKEEPEEFRDFLRFEETLPGTCNIRYSGLPGNNYTDPPEQSPSKE